MLIACVIAFWSFVQRSLQQIQALAEACQRFSSLGTLDDETQQELRIAQTGPIAELGDTAVSIEREIRKRLSNTP